MNIYWDITILKNFNQKGDRRLDGRTEKSTAMSPLTSWVDKNWTFEQGLQRGYTHFVFWKDNYKKKSNYKKQIITSCIIMMQVIPNFRPFRSICYRFRDKHFLHKNGKIGHFSNFWKFDFFFKFSKNLDVFEILKNVVLWSLVMHVIQNVRPFRSISNRFLVLNFN